MAEADYVAQLRAVIGVDTDLALAAELGVERSTIAQWRRRGALPKMYQAILDTDGARDLLDGTQARRRSIYGDGAGRWVLQAALAVLPTSALDYPVLSSNLLGEYRERLVLSIVPLIQEVCERDLGIPKAITELHYQRLVAALGSAENQQRIRRAITEVGV